MVKENVMLLTEIGVLPEDWKVAELGEIAELINGRAYSQFELLSRGKYKVLRVGNFFSSDKWYWSDLELADKFYVENGDLMYAWSASFGPKFWDKEKIIYHYHIWKVNVFKSLNKRFLYHLMIQDKESILNQSQGGTMFHITKDAMEKRKFPLPPLSEQEAIAEALSDADEWIESLEKLIAKKRLIKKGAMQELLKPKEDWEVRNIKNITCNIIDYRGVTPKKLGMEWGNGNIVALSAGNVKKGYIDFGAECYLGSDELYKKWMRNGHPKKNNIVFTLEAPLGNVALLPNDNRYILSQRTVLLQLTSDIEPKFIFQVLLSNKFQNYILESATGSTALGLKRQVFEKMVINIPLTFAEQIRIATILSDMDSELEALVTQLEKARKIKQGMMQELLTGRIRLV